MSIPLDEIYHYINDCLDDDAIIYRFFPHGSKNILDLTPLTPTTTIWDHKTHPIVICHDQEPLNYDWYCKTNNAQGVKDYVTKITTPETFDWIPEFNLSVRIVDNQYQKKVLLHSELNSLEVEKYNNSGLFYPVFWWSHAVIARDWFRYAEHEPLKIWPKNAGYKRINMYCRAWSGSREYRLALLEKIKPVSSLCNVRFNPIDTEIHYSKHCFKNGLFSLNKNDLENYFGEYHQQSSTMSATYSIQDYKNSLFDCVLETVFDDQRIHITEKTLRPIALGQPFILAAGPGSLEFLKSQGFLTFGELIDESYDLEVDSSMRLLKIAKVIDHICKKQWSNKEIQKLQDICEHNRRWFFSAKFQSKILDDLKINLQSAISQIKQDYNCFAVQWTKKILNDSNAESQIFHCQRWLKKWDQYYLSLKAALSHR